MVPGTWMLVNATEVGLWGQRCAPHLIGAVDSGAQHVRLWATLPSGGPTNAGRG